MLQILAFLTSKMFFDTVRYKQSWKKKNKNSKPPTKQSNALDLMCCKPKTFATYLFYVSKKATSFFQYCHMWILDIKPSLTIYKTDIFKLYKYSFPIFLFYKTIPVCEHDI